MRFLVLDPMSGGLSGRLFRIDADGSVDGDFAVGYAAEARFHASSRDLVILESDARAVPMKYYLRLVDVERMTETVRREIPVRPMYAGFPGRSVAGSISLSARYVYFLRSGPVLRRGDDLTFRLTPVRWDRTRDSIEVGKFHVDSCHVDYGVTGVDDDELFLHLSCECSSTVAFGSFSSPGCDLVRMEDLPRREHGPLETIGSWLDPGQGCLYCVNRLGTIYEVRLHQKTCRVLAALPLERERTVPVHQICVANEEVHVGVAENKENMGLGMVSEIWSVSVDSGAFLGKRLLSRPVMSFVVTPDGERLAGVDPYSRTVFCLECASDEEIWNIRGLGVTPGEISVID